MITAVAVLAQQPQQLQPSSQVSCECRIQGVCLNICEGQCPRLNNVQRQGLRQGNGQRGVGQGLRQGNEQGQGLRLRDGQCLQQGGGRQGRGLGRR